MDVWHQTVNSCMLYSLSQVVCRNLPTPARISSMTVPPTSSPLIAPLRMKTNWPYGLWFRQRKLVSLSAKVFTKKRLWRINRRIQPTLQLKLVKTWLSWESRRVSRPECPRLFKVFMTASWPLAVHWKVWQRWVGGDMFWLVGVRFNLSGLLNNNSRWLGLLAHCSNTAGQSYFTRNPTHFAHLAILWQPWRCSHHSSFDLPQLDGNRDWPSGSQD